MPTILTISCAFSRTTALSSCRALVIASRKSLRDWRAHGLYRLFAFEAILILILLNAQQWFVDPFSPRQLVSWALLIGSAALAAAGFYLLYKRGQPESHVETTTVVVQEGVYKYIRHPLYVSLIVFAWGAYLKAPSLLGGIVAGVASVAMFVGAKVEEKECLAKFGRAYADYMASSKMFIPFVL